LLNLIPDRIGHGTCIHPENGGAEDLVNIVEEHSIPIGKFKLHYKFHSHVYANEEKVLMIIT